MKFTEIQVQGYRLRALHQDVYTRVEDVLRVGFPGFERLEFPTVGAGQVTLAWYQGNLTVPLYPNQLSEGTLRFLWLTTVLLAPDPPPVILVDEPEVSLHPELVKLLAGLLQDAAARTQVIVATHSSDARQFLRNAVGDEPRFYAHAAQYDVEARLLPYWDFICKRLGVQRTRPSPDPEQVNLERPPSRRLDELYRVAKPPRKYVKPIEMAAILRNQDLTVAAAQCPELKNLLNTLLSLADLTLLS